jgi:geranylgeranyl diphosphate synthase type I
MNIDQLKSGVNEALTSQISEFTDSLIEIDNQLVPVAEALADFLSDGKRFRPTFALIGYLGGGGELNKNIYCAVASLEFLQASALIHDDLMDNSDLRRGKAAIHKQFGSSAAILIGDLALVWDQQSYNRSGAANSQASEIHDVMRTELMAGQFLDVYEQTQNTFSIERSLKIARYKSGKYSIERPLHFGAALAAPNNLAELMTTYSEYGLPLGEAFQLRDDLLGVFGDSKETGKPAGDDLREGKRTALIAYAYERGSGATKALIESKLGGALDNADIELLREAIIESGAVVHIEDLIEKLAEQALEAIEILPQNQLLTEMVSLVTKRTR